MVEKTNTENEYPQFEFEKKLYDPKDFKGELKVLNIRLDLLESPLEEKLNNEAIAFINVHIRNIEWYTIEIKREEWRICGYKWLTLFLIAILPIITYYMTSLAASNPLSGKMWIKDFAEVPGLVYYSGGILTILSSLFGLHKALNTWMAKRKLLSIYHEASSNLKANLYAFEDKWNTKDKFKEEKASAAVEISRDFSKEFENDLEAYTTKGRAIANKERKQYYEYIENPSVDLDTIFKSAFGTATLFFNNFKSKLFERKLQEQERERKENEAAKERTKKIGSLEKAIEELQRIITGLEGDLVKPDNKDKKPELQARIKEFQKELDKKEIELITEQSKL